MKKASSWRSKGWQLRPRSSPRSKTWLPVSLRLLWPPSSALREFGTLINTSDSLCTTLPFVSRTDAPSHSRCFPWETVSSSPDSSSLIQTKSSLFRSRLRSSSVLLLSSPLLSSPLPLKPLPSSQSSLQSSSQLQTKEREKVNKDKHAV